MQGVCRAGCSRTRQVRARAPSGETLRGLLGWQWMSESEHHAREVGAALNHGALLAHPGLAFLGLNCAPASVDLQQPAVLAVVAHAPGYKAVVLAEDLRCDQGEGGPVHGITVFKVASLLR